MSNRTNNEVQGQVTEELSTPATVVLGEPVKQADEPNLPAGTINAIEPAKQIASSTVEQVASVTKGGQRNTCCRSRFGSPVFRLPGSSFVDQHRGIRVER